MLEALRAELAHPSATTRSIDAQGTCTDQRIQLDGCEAETAAVTAAAAGEVVAS